MDGMKTSDENIRKTVIDRLKGQWIPELVFAVLYPLSHLLAWISVLFLRNRAEPMFAAIVEMASLFVAFTLLFLSALVLKRNEADKVNFALRLFANAILCLISWGCMCFYPYDFVALIATVGVTGAYLWMRYQKIRRYIAIFNGEYKVSDACVIYNEVKYYNGYFKHKHFLDVTLVDRTLLGLDVYINHKKIYTIDEGRHSCVEYHFMVRADSDQSVYEIQTDRKTFNKHLKGYRGKVIIFDLDDRGEKAMMI